MDIKKNKSAERNSGIDLLRIVCMIMIVLLHIVGVGGLVGISLPFINTGVVHGIRAVVICSVNCYALISGYVGIHSRQRISSLAELWVRVAFYSVTISFIFWVVSPELASLKTVIDSFFPVTNGQYWYFTAYFGMWFFIPLAKAAVNNISKGKMGFILLASAFIMIIPTLTRDSFVLLEGYSPLWLFLLYVLGAYIGKYQLFAKATPLRALAVFLGCALFTLMFKFVFYLLGLNSISNILYKYTSPTIIISAISLLILFRDLKISPIVKKIIAFLSPLSFSVYLIHTHPLIFQNLLKDRFVFLGNKSPILLIAVVLSATLGIYIICIAIDYLRLLLFKACKIKKILSSAETKLQPLISKCIDFLN